MPKGDSGRIVVDVEPALKRQLYSALAMDSCTLKEWFIRSAKNYLDGKTALGPSDQTPESQS